MKKIFKNYAIEFCEKSFSVWVNDSVWFRLPISSSADTKEKYDCDFDAINLSIEETQSNITAVWKTQSNLWYEKIYKITADENGFHYTFNIKGEGNIKKIRYFTDKNIARYYQVSGYLLPIATHLNRNNLTKNVFEESEISLGYFAPPPFVFPFFTEDEAGWFGLGLTARKGEYNFDKFLLKRGLTLELPLYNRVAVNGEWEAQGIWGGFGEDAIDVIKEYSEWHYRTALCTRHNTENRPEWWRGPIFCGWGEQQALASVNAITIAGDNKQHITAKLPPAELATQSTYEKIMQTLKEKGLKPKFIIIDARWQETDGNLVVDKAKWRDMRSFVDAVHREGIRVVLWIRSWSCAGLPHDECIKSLTNPIALDPTNPKFIERTKKNLYTLLSSEEGCMDCDGFKIDFINCIPEGNNIQAHKDGIYGVELIKEWLHLIKTTSKSIKSDALMNVSCAHPYLAEDADQIRLHDIHGETCSSNSIMSFRSEVANAVYPNILIDTDSGGIFSHKDFIKYMKHQSLIGIPDLYYLSPICDIPMDDEDFDIIRTAWKNYLK